MDDLDEPRCKHGRPLHQDCYICEEEAAVPERHDLIKAQKSLCQENGWPFFAPSSGYCYACQRDSVTEWWATSHITYCPRCNRSFCD